MAEDFERMLDRNHKPTQEEILAHIEKKAKTAWLELKHLLEHDYGIYPETVFWGKKYGWLVRYRKGGRTLCSLFPEKSGFSALIVLGRKESEKALLSDEPSRKMKDTIRNTAQLHDGRWLWIRVATIEDVKDVENLLLIKKKPRSSSGTH